MELFSKNKNKYFDKVLNIINDGINGENYSKQDIVEILSKDSFNFNEEDKDFEEFQAALLEPEVPGKNKYGKIDVLYDKGGHYVPAVKAAVPVRPSPIETAWLKSMLEDPIIKFHLEDELLSKLKERMADVPETFDKDLWIKRNVDINPTEEYGDKLKNVLGTVLEAIKRKKCIKYSSTSKGGVRYEGKTGYPYRVEYSLRNDKYRLSLFTCEDVNRAVKINLSQFEKVDIIEEADSSIEGKFDEFLEGKRLSENPLVIEVEDKFNAVERCFSLFSFYEKEAYFDKDRNKHMLTVYYYEFDEAEIIKDILSLGSLVTVIKPLIIREEVIRRIEKALSRE